MIDGRAEPNGQGSVQRKAGARGRVRGKDGLKKKAEMDGCRSSSWLGREGLWS